MAKGTTKTKGERQDAILGGFQSVIRNAEKNGIYRRGESNDAYNARKNKERDEYERNFKAKRAAIEKFERENKPNFTFTGVTPDFEYMKKKNAEYTIARKKFLAEMDAKYGK